MGEAGAHYVGRCHAAPGCRQGVVLHDAGRWGARPPGEVRRDEGHRGAARHGGPPQDARHHYAGHQDVTSGGFDERYCWFWDRQSRSAPRIGGLRLARRRLRVAAARVRQVHDMGRGRKEGERSRRDGYYEEVSLSAPYSAQA